MSLVQFPLLQLSLKWLFIASTKGHFAQDTAPALTKLSVCVCLLEKGIIFVYEAHL